MGGIWGGGGGRRERRKKVFTIRAHTHHLCLCFPDPLPVAVDWRVGGNEAGYVLLLVGLEVEALLLPLTSGLHVECHCVLHHPHSHTSQLGELVLRHDLRGGRRGGSEGGSRGGREGEREEGREKGGRDKSSVKSKRGVYTNKKTERSLGDREAWERGKMGQC